MPNVTEYENYRAFLRDYSDLFADSVLRGSRGRGTFTDEK